MKTIIIAFALILSPFFVYGAGQIVPDIKSWDFKAVIQTEDSKSIKVYRFDDVEKKTSCYITYFSGWTNGNQTGISCVK